MTGRNRQLANQLDAALEGRAMSLPDDLLPLLTAADELRAAARRIEPDYSLARQRIDRALRPEGRVAQLPRSEPRWRMRLVAAGLTATAAVIPATVASTSAVPGDPLYPLKRGIEQVRVIAATSPAAEAAARTDIAYARLAELDALLKSGDLDRVPQVLMDLRTAMGEASEAVAIARQEGADSTQVAALESQLASVDDRERDQLTRAMETLPPEKAEELQDVLETVPPTTVPPKGGDGRGSDGAGPTPTSAPPTTVGGGSGTGGEPSPTAPPTTTEPPTTTQPPTSTEAPTTTTQAPDATSSPSADGP
jgi:hypothetical protein